MIHHTPLVRPPLHDGMDWTAATSHEYHYPNSQNFPNMQIYMLLLVTIRVNNINSIHRHVGRRILAVSLLMNVSRIHPPHTKPSMARIIRECSSHENLDVEYYHFDYQYYKRIHLGNFLVVSFSSSSPSSSPAVTQE